VELALQTDGVLAALRVIGAVSMGETHALSDYLRVARENGAVRCVVDFSSCTELPTTIVAVLMRESAKLAEAGGVLALSGLTGQNPFLEDAAVNSRFAIYRTLDEATEEERRKSETSAHVGAQHPAP